MSREILRQQLRTTLMDLEKQEKAILDVSSRALNGFEPVRDRDYIFSLRDQSGAYTMPAILLARAQCLAALVMIEESRVRKHR